MRKKVVKESAILLIFCPDNQGLVATVTDFLFQNHGNVLYLDQYVDNQKHTFLMRIEWDLAGFLIPKDKIAEYFNTLIAQKYNMQFTLHFSTEIPRLALFVSKLPHCFYDILARWQTGEFKVDIPLIISNHPDLGHVAEQYGVDFEYIPISADNKAEQEARELELLAKYQIDFIVLARYMQILSADLISHYANRIINIHHSFLPAFAGARPYHAAYKRGVKIIGATSHYVTADLDAGPIIEQDVTRVTHTDSIKDLIRKGRDLEKIVLSRAVWLHLQRRTLVYDNRTVVFD